MSLNIIVHVIVLLVILLLFSICIHVVFWKEKNATSSEENEDRGSGGNRMIDHDPTYNYRIAEIPRFLTDEECDYIIRLSKSLGLQKSELYDEDADTIDETVRKSEHVFIKDEEDKFVAELSKKIADLVKVPVSHQEMLQVVHYGPGGKYEPHYDACIYEEKGACDRMNGPGGHRYLTVLIYLNTPEEGGGTIFPYMNIKMKAEKGKAIIFENIYKDTEKVIHDSMHGGELVTKGEKWIANKWIHIRPM